MKFLKRLFRRKPRLVRQLHFHVLVLLPSRVWVPMQDENGPVSYDSLERAIADCRLAREAGTVSYVKVCGS